MGYNNKDFGEYTGTWIPAIIMLNEKLKPMEKMLYAEIASFRQCYASNKWLAERLGTSERSVQRGVKKLKDMQLITVFETENSRICVAATTNLHPPHAKMTPPPDKLAYKNNNKNKEEIEHTSKLRSDDLPASSSAGVGDKDSPNESAARAAHLRKVFDALVSILQPGQKILYTPKRKSHLNARLQNFKPSQLVEAARNLMKDPWNTGNNPQNKKYADFDFLTRSDEQVEKWLNAKAVSKPKSVF